MAEPLSDKQLEILGQEIAIPLQVHAVGPIAQLAQRNAWASLNYLITKYQELRAVAAQQQTELDETRPIVKEVATRGLGGIPRIQFYEQAKAFIAAQREGQDE